MAGPPKPRPLPPPEIHPTAEVSPHARIGKGTCIWHQAQVREGAALGRECIVGKGAYIDAGVTLGDRCKVENYACIYGPCILEPGAFVGPGAIICNDRRPRSTTPGGRPKVRDDWQREGVSIHVGASIGAGAIILPGIVVGDWAMVGAGAVVTRCVRPFSLVLGVPAVEVGLCCLCGRTWGLATAWLRALLGRPYRCGACGMEIRP